ncbi:MAG TPA: LPS export ABC transporter periplasmic protein LptC [Candidatus Hydrogenedentes bacterium]|nr:LPS export ABC transporter periplasmic protein LptC [Candidatus Hydrogenedentota bacterium]
MNRLFASMLVGLALTGCNQPAAPNIPAAGTPGIPSLDEMGQTEVRDIDFYLHRTDPTGGMAQKPTLWVHAQEASMADESTYAFKNAHAVIYGKDETQEVIKIDAQEGRFEEGKSAFLSGQVKAVVGTMTIELSDIQWQNPDKDKPGEARSDNPVKVTDPQLELQAASVRLYPDKKEFELTGVTGLVRFGRQQQ